MSVVYLYFVLFIDGQPRRKWVLGCVDAVNQDFIYQKIVNGNGDGVSLGTPVADRSFDV